VAYNVWQYYQATGDRLFLADQGAEMVGEVARFFGDLATYDPGRGRFVIRGVMGPDEFHSGYPDRPEPGIDNNAYTNVLAVWTLRRALEILRMLPRRRREELVETLGLTDAVTEHWRHLTKRMYVPFQADGAISQFDGYDRLAELDWDAYRAHYGDLQRLDRVLSAERDNVNRYQVSKQADVLMLFYLLSAEELDEILTGLGYSPDAEMIPRTIDYYLARTCHGSTLSAVVHAWVLARANRGQAPAYLARALDSDITDIQGGTTAEGIHLAAMAGSVDLIQRGFAGVETRADTLHLNPYWPEEAGALELGLTYRGHALTLAVQDGGIQVRAAPGTHRPIQVHCRGETRTIRPGGEVTFPLAGPGNGQRRG